MTAPLTMYGFWRSQATFRVRVALNIKGIAYEEIAINLDDGEQHSNSFRAKNPLGGVPVLMVADVPLTQSLAILEYLEETQPAPALLPGDPIGRARVRSLAAIAVSDAHPLIVPRVKRYLTDHAGFDAARWKAWQTQWFSAALHGYEARLSSEHATGAYCHGDTPTLADICLCGLHAGVTTFGIDVDGIPTVERIVALCMSQPTFEAAKGSNQKDFPG